jgi:hypothetical protein
MTTKGIIQIDAELTEDGKAVMLYGLTRSADRTYTALVDLPKPISEDSFDADDEQWKRAATRAAWVLHA